MSGNDLLPTQGGLEKIFGLDGPTSTTSRAQRLLIAVQRIGRELGFEARLPKGVSEDDIEPHAIALASGVRRRGIVLTGNWWKTDQGPLLCWHGIAREPVALIPSPWGGYWMHDPATGRRLRVTAKVASHIAANAECFYAAFPESKLTFHDIVAFRLWHSWHDMLLLILAGSASALLAVSVPYAIGALFTDLVPSGARTQIMQVGLALVLAAIGGFAMDCASGRAQTRLTGRCANQLNAALWDRMLRLDANFIEQLGAGDAASRVAMGERLQGFVLGIVHDLATRGQHLIVSLVTMFVVAPLAALGALGMGILLLGALWLMVWVQTRAIMHGDALRGNVYNQPVEYLGALPKLRAAGAEERAFERWSNNFVETRRRSMKAGSVGIGFQTFTAAYQVLAVAVLFAMLAEPTKGVQPLSVAMTLVMLSAFSTFLQSLVPLAQSAMSLSSMMAQRRRLLPIMETVPPSSKAAMDPGKLLGQVVLDAVSARYGRADPLAIDRVSLVAEPGEFVAIVGPSGSGKSTLVRVLLGMTAPQQGCVLYDGRDLSTLVTDRVRQQIGTVMQAGRLVPGSVRDNIAGPFTATDEQIWEAAHLAAVDQDIEAMPMQLHTVVLDGAAAFSGGQVQRILIARSLVAKPPMVILDEATSALDARTQALVVERVGSLRCTRIVIAHRFSTIRHADRVYVMKEGRVVESGSVAALLKSGGYLAEMAGAENVSAMMGSVADTAKLATKDLVAV